MRVVQFDGDMEIFNHEDYLANDLAVEVPITELMHMATESVDGFNLDTWQGWQNMLHFKAMDSGFQTLVDSIMERGLDPSCPIGFDYGYEISEGHHRLTAAILLGLDTVYVSRWSRGDYSEDGVSAHERDRMRMEERIVLDVEGETMDVLHRALRI